MTQDAIMMAAATLTAGVVGNMPCSGQISPDGKVDAGTMAKDLYEWEVFRIFYAGLAGIHTDPASWPVPPPNAPPPVRGPLTGAAAVGILQQLAAGTPSIAGAVTAIIAQLQAGSAPASPPAAPVPLPVGTAAK